jgi:hypothetical protein
MQSAARRAGLATGRQAGKGGRRVPGKKKARHGAGLEKFGRGCLKGRLSMAQIGGLCKCERYLLRCKERNRQRSRWISVRKNANFCLFFRQSLKNQAEISPSGPSASQHEL